MNRTELHYALALTVLLAAGSGCAADSIGNAVPPREVALKLVTRSGPLPYTEKNELTVVSPAHACIFDSYEFQFVCGDRAWTDTVRFGRKGHGPGELAEAGMLVNGPGGLLVHVASMRQRLSLFTAEHEFLRSMRPPSWHFPLGDLDPDSVLAMAQLTFAHNYGRVVWFSIPRDTIVEDHTYRFDASVIGKDTVYLSPPQLTPGGEVVFKAGKDHLAWFSREGEFLAVAAPPDFGTVYPLERDVEERRYAMERLSKVSGRPPRLERIEAFRHRPLGRIEQTTQGGKFRVDPSNRVWVTTTRPSEVGTYLAVFRRGEYLGEIEVPGRLLNFQIADSLLVALVEEVEPDGAGLYPRRLDWYRIISP